MSAKPRGAVRPERLGRYLVFDAFARGGMGTVHLGRLLGDSGFSRLVAVKKPHAQYALDDAYGRMLLDEARLSSRIRHPNVVETLDVVKNDGQLLLVMEYVHGVSLASLLAAVRRSGGFVPVAIVAQVVVDLLRGLQAAHEARAEDGTPLGIVHRDVSPQNILVGADGVSRVLDFGVAKALQKEHLTKSGDVKGKLAYMSPEQVRGQTVTRQSDLFVAGIVLWEALTDRKLFAHEDMGVVVHRLLTQTPPPPSAHRKGIPAAVDAIVARALTHALQARFATAEEMALALAGACPLAGAEEVARFVQYAAGEELEVRAERVRAVENHTLEEALAEIPRAVSAPMLPALPAPPKRAHRRVALASGIAAVVALTLVTILGQRALKASALARSESIASAAPPAFAALAEPPPPVVEIPDVPAVTSASQDNVLELEDLPARRPVGRPSIRVPSRPAKPQATTSRPTLDPNGCEPPYSIDEKGQKHYKSKCLP